MSTERLRATKNARSGAWKVGDKATYLPVDKKVLRPGVRLDEARLFACKTIHFKDEDELRASFETTS